MEKFFPPTDRVIQHSKFYYFRKKYLRPSYFIFLIIIIAFFLLDYLLTERLPNNLLRGIQYRRNSINIQLVSETVEEMPEYTLQQESGNQYCLTVKNSRIRYNTNRNYEYGAVSNVQITQEKKDVKYSLTFGSLKDIPEIQYIQDPPHFNIHFNHYLDDKFFVVIDPGHGGEGNSGAIGKKGTREKEIVLDIAIKLKNLLLVREDIKVFLTRTKDQHVGLFQRRRMANFWDADLFLSIHANSAPNSKVNQTEIYYASGRSRKIAGIIRDGFENDLGNGRCRILRRRFAVLRGNSARLGAVLIETMYLSNQTGERLMSKEVTRKIIAESLYTAIDTIIKQSY